MRRARALALALLSSSSSAASDLEAAGREYKLGRAAFEAADFETAEPHFLKAVAAAPEFPEPHYALAQIMLRTDRHEEARWRMALAEARMGPQPAAAKAAAASAASSAAAAEPPLREAAAAAAAALPLPLPPNDEGGGTGGGTGRQQNCLQLPGQRGVLRDGDKRRRRVEKNGRQRRREWHTHTNRGKAGQVSLAK